MNLNLTGQSVERDAIAPKLLRLKSLLDQRKPVWDRLPREVQKRVIVQDRDPVLSLAWDIYRYLDANFFEGVD